MNKSMSLKCLNNGLCQKINGETLYFINENLATKLSITYPSTYSDDYEKWVVVDINGVTEDIYLGTGNIVTLDLSYEYFQYNALKLQPYVFGLNSEKTYWEVVEYGVENTMDSNVNLIQNAVIVIIGDTIKITVEFKTIEGSYIDPTNAMFNVYNYQDRNNNPIYSRELGINDKISIGVYEVYYTIPEEYNILYFEFTGDNGDEKLVYRGQLKPRWLS